MQFASQLTHIAGTEPGVVLFKVDSLQCQVFLNPTHMQSLHLKVSPLAPNPAEGKPPVQWNPDDLQIIEQFFELRVAAPPYRPNALCGFGRALNVPPQVLKDFVHLMRLDLMSEPMPAQKWNVQFCMRVPPAAPPIVPVGSPGILKIAPKILFFVSRTFPLQSRYRHVLAVGLIVSIANVQVDKARLTCQSC